MTRNSQLPSWCKRSDIISVNASLPYCNCNSHIFSWLSTIIGLDLDLVTVFSFLNYIHSLSDPASRLSCRVRLSTPLQPSQPASYVIKIIAANFWQRLILTWGCDRTGVWLAVTHGDVIGSDVEQGLSDARRTCFENDWLIQSCRT